MPYQPQLASAAERKPAYLVDWKDINYYKVFQIKEEDGNASQLLSNFMPFAGQLCRESWEGQEFLLNGRLPEWAHIRKHYFVRRLSKKRKHRKRLSK